MTEIKHWSEIGRHFGMASFVSVVYPDWADEGRWVVLKKAAELGFFRPSVICERDAHGIVAVAPEGYTLDFYKHSFVPVNALMPIEDGQKLVADILEKKGKKERAEKLRSWEPPDRFAESICLPDISEIL